MRAVLAMLLTALASLAVALPAHAHPLAPAALHIVELGDGALQVDWKRPRLVPRGVVLAPELPADCTPGGVQRRVLPDAVEERFRLRCGAALVGQRVGVRGLQPGAGTAIVSYQSRQGQRVQALLDSSQTSLVIPARRSAGSVLIEYARLGLGHLAGGFDHLAFLIGLLVLVRGGRRLLAAVSAFTLGHALTLVAATLGWIVLPSRLVETGIALSLVWVALTMLGNHQAAPRRAVLAAGAFGLLHGLGFAGALAEAGLPLGQLPIALLGFNLGIELGQLVVVGAGVAFLRASRLFFRHVRLRTLAAHTVGALGVMWLLERLLVS